MPYLVTIDRILQSQSLAMTLIKTLLWDFIFLKKRIYSSANSTWKAPFHSDTTVTLRFAIKNMQLNKVYFIS